VPLPRFDKLDPDRQRRLLAAAAHEFAAHGFEGSSLSRISEAAGISKASVYYYFSDKVDLYTAVIREAWRAIVPPRPLDEEALDAASFWPQLRHQYVEMLERTRREAWLPAAGKLVYHPDPAAGAGPLVAQEFRRAQAFLERLIHRGQGLGVVRSDMPAGLLVSLVAASAEAADHWMVDHWEHLDRVDAERLALQIFDVLRGVASPGPAEERA
jgi:AcrR family transcriptional regulator